MCTLTWFTQPGGYQLFFNRDELRTRKPALAPSLASAGDVRYLAPSDGDHGGTWICVNDRGMTLCLLNGYSTSDPAPPTAGFDSRGELPRALISRETLAAVGDGLVGSTLSRYRSFVLVAFAPDGACARWDWREGRLRSEAALSSESPVVSSSFDTDAVRQRREALFRTMGSERSARGAEFHLAYHESHLPERGPYAPCMHREDAQTVSLSWVDVGTEQVCMRYTARSPCRGRPQDPPLCLPRRRGISEAGDGALPCR